MKLKFKKWLTFTLALVLILTSSAIINQRDVLAGTGGSWGGQSASGTNSAGNWPEGNIAANRYTLVDRDTGEEIFPSVTLISSAAASAIGGRSVMGLRQKHRFYYTNGGSLPATLPFWTSAGPGEGVALTAHYDLGYQYATQPPGHGNVTRNKFINQRNAAREAKSAAGAEIYNAFAYAYGTALQSMGLFHLFPLDFSGEMLYNGYYMAYHGLKNFK